MKLQNTPFGLQFQNSILALANAFYPKRCGSCTLDIPYNSPSVICKGCRSMIQVLDASVCRVCGEIPEVPGAAGKKTCRSCQIQAHFFDAARSYAAYAGPLKELIHQFKYQGKDYWAEELGDMLFDCWRSWVEFQDAEFLVSVPPHGSRLRERGYDHTLLLAQAFLERHRDETRGTSIAPILLCKGELVRTKRTPTQTSLSKEERRTNVSGAFEWRGKTDIRGKKLLLIDDVCTTGATLDACARALKAAGAREVLALAIARD